MLETSASTTAVTHAESFVAAGHFKVDTSTKAEVRICCLSPYFMTYFLPSIEEHKRFESTLAYVWELLKEQPCGEKGILFTDGRLNPFQIRDKNGLPRGLSARWRADLNGWDLSASGTRVEGGNMWLTTRQRENSFTD